MFCALVAETEEDNHNVHFGTCQMVQTLAAINRKLLFVLLHSMPGLKIMYYGEELGMNDGVNSNIDSIGRDRYRSPFPWHKNFEIKGWIEKHPNSNMINLESQIKDTNSYYHFVLKVSIQNHLLTSDGCMKNVIFFKSDLFNLSYLQGVRRYTSSYPPLPPTKSEPKGG